MLILEAIQVDGAVTPETNNTRNLGSSSLAWATIYAATDVKVGGFSVWTSGNDGAASGLDADLLDGQQGSYYLPVSSYTATDVLTKVKTVDGAGSGLDADLLDGQQGSYYLPVSSYTAADVLAKIETVDGANSGLDADLLDGQQGAWYADTISRLGYTPINKAGDTGIGALTLTGTLTVPGGVHVLGNASGAANNTAWVGFYDSGNTVRTGYIGDSVSSTLDLWVQAEQGDLILGSTLGSVVIPSTTNLSVGNNAAVTGTLSADTVTATTALTLAGSPVWTAANDGASSGLDADLLDGQQGTYYLAYANLTGVPSTFAPSSHVLATTTGLGAQHTTSGLTAGQVLRATGATTAAFQNLIAADIPNLDAGKITTGTFGLARIPTITVPYGGTGLTAYTAGNYINAATGTTLQQRTPTQVLSDIGALAASSYTASDILTKIKTVDGAGSGLDADLLDAQTGSYYLAWANLTGVPSTFAPSAHVLATTTALGAEHTVSGLTAGQVLRATGTTTAAFQSLIAADIPNLSTSILTSGTLGVVRGGTGIASYTAGNYINALSASTLQQRTPAQVLTDIGALASSSYTAADVLAKIKTVDGAASGLDADLLDGHDSTYFLDTTTNQTISGQKTLTNDIVFDNYQITSPPTYPSPKHGFSWKITTDSAGMRAYERGGDTLEYEFWIADNPASADRFVWKNSSWQGGHAGIEGMELHPGGSATVRNSFSFYGGLTLLGPSVNDQQAPSSTNTNNYSTITVVRNNIFEYDYVPPGSTLIMTPDASGYTGTNLQNYVIAIIDASVTPNKFAWKRGASWNLDQATASNWTGYNLDVSISPIALDLGVSITFNATSGGVTGEVFGFSVLPGGQLRVANPAAQSFIDGTLSIGNQSSATTGYRLDVHGDSLFEGAATVNSTLHLANYDGAIQLDTSAFNTSNHHYWHGPSASGDNVLSITRIGPSNYQWKINAVDTVWTSGNDGASSGLDADLLDGQQGSYYLAWGNLTGVPSTFTPSAHVLATTTGLGAEHTVSGLTSGQVLRATGATTAAFGSLVASDIPSLDASKITTGTFNIAQIPTITATKGGTGLTAYTAGNYINAVSSSALQQRTPAQVLSDIGALAASSYTAADILTKLKTVDGAASGLDADLLDGQHGSYYYSSANPPALMGLTDTSIVTPATGDALIYNGTAWGNVLLSNSFVDLVSAQTISGGKTFSGGLSLSRVSGTDNLMVYELGSTKQWEFGYTTSSTPISISMSPSVNGDTWYVRSDGSGWTSTNPWTGMNDATVEEHLGVKFANVAIPVGATITSATITANSLSGDGGGAKNVDIKGYIAGANPTSPTTLSEAIAVDNSANKTTATVQWVGPLTYPTTALTTPDISSVVQEVVNQSYWVSGQSMILFIQGNATNGGGGNYDTEFDGTATTWTLNVTYTTSGADNLVAKSYDGTGTYLDTPLTINRSTSEVSLSGLLSVVGGINSTGAININGRNVVASGSNTNGNYVRYSDGTQICWHTDVETPSTWSATGYGGSSYYTANPWYFPTSFVADPTWQGSVSATDGRVGRRLMVYVANAVSTSSASSVVVEADDISGLTTILIHHLAIGRWY